MKILVDTHMHQTIFNVQKGHRCAPSGRLAGRLSDSRTFSSSTSNSNACRGSHTASARAPSTLASLHSLSFFAVVFAPRSLHSLLFFAARLAARPCLHFSLSGLLHGRYAVFHFSPSRLLHGRYTVFHFSLSSLLHGLFLFRCRACFTVATQSFIFRYTAFCISPSGLLCYTIAMLYSRYTVFHFSL